MKRKFLAGIAAGLMLLGMTVVANATVIDFEDLGYVADAVFPAPGYAGFTWGGGFDDFSWVISSQGGFYTTTYGFTAHAGQNFSWSNGGVNLSLSGSLFDFNSMWVRSGSVPVNVVAQGIANGNLQYTQNFFVTTEYQLFDFSFAGVDNVTISPEFGYNLLIDDISINAGAPVPEPGTMLLLGFGIAGLAIYGKRRTNRKDA